MFCALNVGDPSQSLKALVFLNNVKANVINTVFFGLQANIINSVNNGIIIFERLCFLAAQDSSIGDIVSQSLSQ